MVYGLIGEKCEILEIHSVLRWPNLPETVMAQLTVSFRGESYTIVRRFSRDTWKRVREQGWFEI